MTNETKHTPGPWVVRCARVFGAKSAKVCDVLDWADPNPTAEANASLIAIAPDLLAFARSIIERHDKAADALDPPEREEDGHMTCGCWECERAEELIAKAEGRTP